MKIRLFANLWGRGEGRERQRVRQRDRETERDTEREEKRERKRGKRERERGERGSVRDRHRNRERERDTKRKSPCYIAFHSLLLANLKKTVSQKIAKTVFVGKVPLSKTASFKATTSHFVLNKVLSNLAPFLLNNVTGFVFCFIIKV